MTDTPWLLTACLVLVCSGSSSAQRRPAFSGTWRWVSRTVPHLLTITQTPDELTIESLGLPQGNPAGEIFELNGSSKTTIYDAQAFWRKQETTARWDNGELIGTVRAKASWKANGPGETISLAIPHTVCTRTLLLSTDGQALTIATSWYPFESGNSEDATDRFVRADPQR